jgi:murein biosynthesis integral membrane protein MurJ
MSQQEPHQKRTTRDVIRQSGTTSIAAAASVLSGLVLDVVIAATYGAGTSTDAFFVAARIPLGLVAIVMVGANQALVPAISTWLVRKGRDETWRLTSLLSLGTLGLVGGLSALLALAALPLMRLTAPGLPADSIALAASLSRVMFIVVPLVALAEVFRALLNALHSFLAPAAMHVVMNGLAVGAILWRGDGNVHVIAWAYVAGSLAQLLFMIGIAHRKGFRMHRGMGIGDPEVVAVGRLCVRPLLGAGLNPLARVGEQLFVSYLPAGSITILNYGYRLVSAIGGTVLFRSVIVVLLPRLTRVTAEGDEQGIRSNTRLGIRILLVISVALTVLMAVLSVPAVRALFHRGSFSETDATILGFVMVVYSASIIGSGVQRGMLAPFFARLDTRTPLRNTLYGVVANLILVPICMLPFGSRDPYAVIGVAAAYSIAQYVNVAHIWFHLRRELGIRSTGMAALALPLVAAAGTATGVLLLGYRLLDLGGTHHGRLSLLLRTVAVGLAGLAVFAAVGSALRLPDLRRLRSSTDQT